MSPRSAAEAAVPEIELKLKGCWQVFESAVIPEFAPQAQRDAMYQAFLAGADTVLQVMESTQQRAPSNLKQVTKVWAEQVRGEVRRIVQESQA
jgi:hypothetical protein